MTTTPTVTRTARAWRTGTVSFSVMAIKTATMKKGVRIKKNLTKTERHSVRDMMGKR